MLQFIGIGSFLLFLVSCQSLSDSGETITRAIQDPTPDQVMPPQAGELLNKNELRSFLSKNGASPSVQKKAARLFRTPFIDNSHFEKFGLPEPSINPTLGSALRVSTWNIEKSIHVRELAESLSSEEAFISQLKEEVLKDQDDYANALRQRLDLAHSDILLCQEMDIGHSRSGYLFAAQHLAKRLGMNFAYAPQQLEVDPRDLDALPPNEERYHGVFGVAVLSRYPIKRVEVFPLETQPYDWFEGEVRKPDFVEKSRRFGAKKLFDVKQMREVKVGGRGFMRVDLHVPNVPHETISVINVHLEIKTEPKNRVKQIQEIHTYIHEIENPVIMAGDFNSASRDVSSTSFFRATTRTASNPSTFLSATLFLANATGVNQMRALLNAYKNLQDPLALGIPVIFPNKTKKLFNTIEDFRFQDGGAFDFRGDDERSLREVDGVLSNSNQRSRLKGFKQTFQVPHPLGPLGRERLDWIFVKSFQTHPRDENGPYRLAPHFGETLNWLNEAVVTPFSDHHPISTILPLEEPGKL